MPSREGNAARRARRESPEFKGFLLGVGRRVAWLRSRANLTQESLAAAAQMDLTLVQRIERGDANPTTLVWVDLARALGVEAHQLLKPKREPNPGRRRGPGRPPKNKRRR